MLTAMPRIATAMSTSKRVKPLTDFRMQAWEFKMGGFLVRFFIYFITTAPTTGSVCMLSAFFLYHRTMVQSLTAPEEYATIVYCP